MVTKSHRLKKRKNLEKIFFVVKVGLYFFILNLFNF